MKEFLVGAAITIGPMALLAALSIEFGDRQMSVLDRWLGPRHAWARDHHGID